MEVLGTNYQNSNNLETDKIDVYLFCRLSWQSIYRVVRDRPPTYIARTTQRSMELLLYVTITDNFGDKTLRGSSHINEPIRRGVICAVGSPAKIYWFLSYLTPPSIVINLVFSNWHRTFYRWRRKLLLTLSSCCLLIPAVCCYLFSGFLLWSVITVPLMIWFNC